MYNTPAIRDIKLKMGFLASPLNILWCRRAIDLQASSADTINIHDRGPAYSDDVILYRFLLVGLRADAELWAVGLGWTLSLEYILMLLVKQVEALYS